MDNHYSKKQLEEIYNCEIFKDFGFDSGLLFWTAHGRQIEGTDECLFDYADGWTLDELHENIREAMFDNLLYRDKHK